MPQKSGSTIKGQSSQMEFLTLSAGMISQTDIPRFIYDANHIGAIEWNGIVLYLPVSDMPISDAGIIIDPLNKEHSSYLNSFQTNHFIK